MEDTTHRLMTRPTMMDSAQDRMAWTKLWRAGVLHSCSTAIAGNYDGAISSFWNTRFERLQHGQRVVDIGTGNGALPLLAKQHAHARGILLDLHGADVADVDPRHSVGEDSAMFDGIAFHAGTSADRLPFDSGSVSLVTAQYAFEYCQPRAATLAELLRVAGPHGAIALVMHSEDSLIALTARQQLQGCELLFEETCILDLAQQLIAGLLPANAQDPAPRQDLQQRFQAASIRLVDAADAWPQAAILHKALHYLHGTMQRAQTSPRIALDYLNLGKEDLENEHVRLRHLSRAIMSFDELQDVQRRCKAAGYAATSLAPLDQAEGQRMGWSLVTSP